MSGGVCELLVCICMYVYVCMCPKKKNIRGHQRLCLSVSLSQSHKHTRTHTRPHTQWHTHTVFPRRPSSSAIFPSDYTFHLLIFILICFSQTREGGKRVIGERGRERDGGGQMGEGGRAWSAEREGIWRRDYDFFIIILSNRRCPSYPQAKKQID